jgi:DNA topoisomerase-1
LRKLVSITDYSKLINSLLSEPLRRKFPWQGPREDPAHPAIHPTGEIPKQSLSLEEKKIFDLVVRRFCNAFAPDAIIEKVRVIFNISSHEFSVVWEIIVDEGWMKYYVSKRPSRPKLNQDLNVGEELEIDKATMKESYTTLPPRYNQGSLLYRMESEGIGTKATRAETISTLIKRRYVGNSRDLVPYENALVLIHQLRKECPEIVSPEMTRSLEKQLISLQNEEASEEMVIARELIAIRTALRNLRNMDNFYWKREILETKTKNLLLGKCPNCKTGNLEAIRSFKTKKRFIRCTNYQNICKTSSPLPPRGIIKTTGNVCNVCGWPKITINYSKRLRVSETCSNFACKSREPLSKEAYN